jgi:hypothetical protein
MNDNDSGTNKMRRSFLDNLPSADNTMNDKPRTSFLDSEKDKTETSTTRRGSFIDQVEAPAPVETKRRGSFIEEIPADTKKAETPKRGSFASNMPEPKKVVPTPAVHTGPRNSVFQGIDDPTITNAMELIKKNHPDYHHEHARRLHGMVSKLVNPTVSVITSWGDQALEDQKTLVTRTANIVKEFNALNGNELLNEIITAAGYRKEKSFFQKIKNNFTVNEVNYVSKVEGLKVHLSALMPIMDDLFAKSKDSLLPLWMVSIAGFADVFVTNDKALEMAIHSRRQLLQHAFINVKSAHDQLDNIRIMAVQMMTQTDHVMNVTIPAMLKSQD